MELLINATSNRIKYKFNFDKSVFHFFYLGKKERKKGKQREEEKIEVLKNTTQYA